MSIFIYILYGLLLAAFFVLASFAVFHAFKYEYISPRTQPITWIFVFVSIVLVAVSIYFFIQL